VKGDWQVGTWIGPCYAALLPRVWWLESGARVRRMASWCQSTIRGLQPGCCRGLGCSQVGIRKRWWGRSLQDNLSGDADDAAALVIRGLFALTHHRTTLLKSTRSRRCERALDAGDVFLGSGLDCFASGCLCAARLPANLLRRTLQGGRL
jgi:hypothetical protein